MEGLDGRPFPQGFRSSRMTVAQMSAMIEYMTAWGAENGVRFSA
ncbi:MAG: recombination protein NinB [Beijerinckiaceae bacterium]